MDVTKPYEFIRFGDIHGPKPYKFAVLPGRKSAFRVGFCPDCYREGTEIGPPAGLRPAGGRSRCFPVAVRPGRPISGPEARLRKLEYWSFFENCRGPKSSKPPIDNCTQGLNLQCVANRSGLLGRGRELFLGLESSGRKSGFRDGFLPDSSRENLSIGPPADRRPAGEPILSFSRGVRPRSGPEA